MTIPISGILGPIENSDSPENPTTWEFFLNRAGDSQSESLYICGMTPHVVLLMAFTGSMLAWTFLTAKSLKKMRRQLHISEVSHAMSATLELKEVLRRLRNLTLPNLADGLIVQLVNPEGLLEQVKAVPENLDAARLERIKQLGVRFYVCLPLVKDSKTIGSLTFFMFDATRSFTRRVSDFLQDIAPHAASALGRAALYEESRTAVRSRDDLFSIASHELTTPISNLKLQAQLIRKRAIAATGSGYAKKELLPRLEFVEMQLNKLTRLTDNLLDLARIRNQRLTLERAETNLSELLQESISKFSEKARLQGSTLQMHIRSNICGSLDRIRIEQAIANLLSNAIKYGAGKPINVSLEMIGSDAIIQVKDQGIGISVQDQSRVFNRFERAVSSKDYKGLGLGLHITQQIIENHGGQIGVRSQPGQGSVFTIRLPLEEGEAPSVVSQTSPAIS